MHNASKPALERVRVSLALWAWGASSRGGSWRFLHRPIFAWATIDRRLAWWSNCRRWNASSLHPETPGRAYLEPRLLLSFKRRCISSSRFHSRCIGPTDVSREIPSRLWEVSVKVCAHDCSPIAVRNSRRYVVLPKFRHLHRRIPPLSALAALCRAMRPIGQDAAQTNVGEDAPHHRIDLAPQLAALMCIKDPRRE